MPPCGLRPWRHGAGIRPAGAWSCWPERRSVSGSCADSASIHHPIPQGYFGNLGIASESGDWASSRRSRSDHRPGRRSPWRWGRGREGFSWRFPSVRFPGRLLSRYSPPSDCASGVIDPERSQPFQRKLKLFAVRRVSAPAVQGACDETEPCFHAPILKEWSGQEVSTFPKKLGWFPSVDSVGSHPGNRLK